MSCIEYEIVEIEENINKIEGKTQRTKPVDVSVQEGDTQRAKPHGELGGPASVGNQVACRATEVLNIQLAQGSMPA